jgi:hypothetical protein
MRLSVRKFSDLGQSLAFDALRDVAAIGVSRSLSPVFKGAGGRYGR